jgi:hypothetical protein
MRRRAYLSSKGVYFRGLTLQFTDIFQTLGLFSNRTEEKIGPGIYVTNDLRHAKEHAGSSRAIMVRDRSSGLGPLDTRPWRMASADPN